MLMEPFILIIIILLVCGVVAGFLAGFFGIGGGIIMVPVMYALLSDLGYQDYAMNISVATSAAVILPTALVGQRVIIVKKSFLCGLLSFLVWEGSSVRWQGAPFQFLFQNRSM